MAFVPDNTVLLVIGAQRAFDDPRRGARNNPQAEQQIARLLEIWRQTRRPIVHVQQCSRSRASPFYPRAEGHAFKPEAIPHHGEPVLQKYSNNAFIGTDLELRLRQMGCDTLVIAGFTTPHCISVTARMADSLGFFVTVASDATVAFDLIGPDGQIHAADTVQAMALAALHTEFATIASTADLIETIVCY